MAAGAARLCVAVLCGVLLSACGPSEDPARAEFRKRVLDGKYMSADEVGRLLDEVSKALEGKTVRSRREGVSAELDPELRDIVLGMLTYRPGVFDEGIEHRGDLTLRVVNAPGRPSNMELDAARHLSIDTQTFLPAYFEFTSGVASDEFAFELVVE
jgi:hypothetical protein